MLMVRDNLKTLPERNPPPLRGSPRASTAPHTAVVGQFAGSMIACGARGALRLWLRTAPRSRPREDSPASPGRWSSRKLTHYPSDQALDRWGTGGTRITPMAITLRLYSCDDHLDLWDLPPDVWTDRLPAALCERGPRVVEQGGNAWWTCDGAVRGPFGTQLMKDYSAIARAGIEDDGLRAAKPRLRLEDMDRDGIHASVIYGPNLFGR